MKESQKNVYVCTTCHFMNNQLSYFKKHQHGLHRVNNKFYCTNNTCKYSAKRQSAIDKHSIFHKNLGWNYICGDSLQNLCNFSSRNVNDVYQHITQNHKLIDIYKKKRAYVCYMCYYMVEFLSGLKCHLTSNHLNKNKNNDFKCKYCEYTTNMLKIMKKHLSFHENNKWTFVCTAPINGNCCNFISNNFTEMYDHIKQQHSAH